MRTHRTRYIAAGVAALALGLSACSSSADSAGAGSSAPSGSGEVIVAAADPSLLPYNFLGEDGETWEGINVDLAAALSRELGRDVVFESAGFDTIIPGLASGRYDIALTGMFDTKERQETVDFVDYLLAANNFLTRSDYRDVESMDNLCGEVVGIPGGAIEADLLAEASTACTDAGDEAITVNEFADLDATVLALKSGRIDVTPNDSAANAYILAENPDEVKTSGGYLNEGYFAAAFPKDSELTAELEAAFAAIMADGSYAETLDEWGIADRALDEPIINGSPF
jgi:polar amino acid transport system substrate-binding protein